MEIRLSRNEEHATKEFAELCAEFVRQGVQFKATTEKDEFVIRFTGGF